jgi:hypothetical protein
VLSLHAPGLAGDDSQAPALEFFLQWLDLGLDLLKLEHNAPQRSTSCSLVSVAGKILLMPRVL